MRLGVCYYPEHWPEEMWAGDARQMAEIGLSCVRIGEFAWARFEPEPGRFEWAWFDRAIDTLHGEGLGLILGTPTATPPKRLIDRHPDILAQDAHGRPRRFGSRRHYCFSSETYRRECRRIVSEMVKRYGEHPGVVMWQTDNEYGCHDTVESYSPAAKAAFRLWLKDRYGEIDALNDAWGTTFWSQTYRSFDEVDLPGATVTEANPSHRLDFQRFSSDQVARFNREQVDIIRQHSPGREITHNFMGAFTAFDHHKVGADIDIATWDSYPLGFLDLSPVPDDLKRYWLRQGHPDFQAFHHDLYRGCSHKWGVMEQQPGPVNWAPYNPAPLPGMVRLWSLEAMAHGADLVSWFRWRQVPFAQEHMHAGLQRPDGEPAPAYEEARQVAEDVARLGMMQPGQADVALIFDYEGQWTHMVQPQGRGMDLLRQTFDAYSALRSNGLSIDILPQSADLSDYKLIVLPGLPIIQDALVDQIRSSRAQVVILPRSGSKTGTFQIPPELPPGKLRSLSGVKVVRVESLRPSIIETAHWAGGELRIVNWREHLELPPPDSELGVHVEARFADGAPFWVESDNIHYLAGWPDPDTAFNLSGIFAKRAGLEPRPLGLSLRLRRIGRLEFAFNYGLETEPLEGLLPETPDFILGGPTLPPAGVAAWRS
ncbi:beta-galactosidase [Hyphobacterium sp. CCMP332]|uniref:beta-galactosidase n=1 Tax=Hyphobacterium sp. CCMP332 TaxID=2749086 RepID=UPI00164FD703|nr:beta-galactosidase [Hyphobacterium sp. CCMP332]QNL19682.1 beta-galactosidase [Hyphobacterium sp. CCMP332]